MKNRQRNPHCLNCKAKLTDVYNYCPFCGQENTSSKLTVAELFSDFFNNYLSFDSKLWRSLIPFLFRPGYLTLVFVEGRRAAFVHPIRLYLLISLTFFALFSYNADWGNLLEGIFSGESKVVQERATKYRTERLAVWDSLLKAKAIDEGLYRVRKEWIENLPDREVLRHYYPNDEKQYSSVTLALNNYELHQDRFFHIWLPDMNMTPGALLDSMKAEDKDPLSIRLAEQGQKLAQNRGRGLFKKVIDIAPFALFILMPVFALLLKLLFIRSGRYYIEHLIFSIHLHSFVFLALSIIMTILIFISNQEGLLSLAPLVIFLYALLMWKRVYGQGWLKTLLKFGMVSYAYLFIVLFSVVVEIIVSVLLF